MISTFVARGEQGALASTGQAARYPRALSFFTGPLFDQPRQGGTDRRDLALRGPEPELTDDVSRRVGVAAPVFWASKGKPSQSLARIRARYRTLTGSR